MVRATVRPSHLLALLVPLSIPTTLVAQRDSVLLAGRWVGIHMGRPLQFEFYADSMLVVGDRYPLRYRLTSDSLLASGDTNIVARYRLSYGRLLLEPPQGEVVTMSPQSLLARPVTGRWLGDLGSEIGQPTELVLTTDRLCRWRPVTGGLWTVGEWERETRLLRLTWPDSVEWVGQYDPFANALLFDETMPESGVAIFRRVIRRGQNR